MLVVMLVVMPGLLLQLWQQLLRRSVVQPSDDILENSPDVVGRLTRGEGVPHAWVELERLVLARRRLV